MKRYRDYNPIAVAANMLAAALVAMFSMDPIILAVALTGGIIASLTCASLRKRDHLFALGLFVALVVINPIFSHNGATVLFIMNDSPVTLEATLYGVAAAMMLVSVLYWFRAFTAVMTSDRLLYLFSRLSPRISLVLSMALRTVPMLRKRWQKIEQAQRALGLYRDGNLIDRVRGILRIFSILVTWTLENGVITADSMDARCYGTHRRTSYALFRFGCSDAAVLGLSTGLAALTLWGLSGTNFQYYPTVSYTGSAVTIIGYIAYSGVCLLPGIIELWEGIRWNGYRSTR